MVAKLVEHGFEIVGTFAERPKNADCGCRFFSTDYQRAFTYLNHGPRKVWVPDDGRCFYDSTEKYFVDFFRGPALDNIYSVAKGSDELAALPVIDIDQMGGELDLVTGDAGSGTAADASAIAPSIQFTPSAARVATRLGTRVKLISVANSALFVGLTDALPASTLEMPFTLATATFTSNATNAGGLLFDTAATTDTIRGIGVAADVDSEALDTGLAFAGNTYRDLVMVVTPAGLVSVYVDDVLIGTFEMPANTALVPIIIAESRSTSSRTLSAKYWFCHQDG